MVDPKVGKYNSDVKTLLDSAEFKGQKDVEEKKSMVGDIIYDYVEELTDEEKAPRITGMIIDLNEEEMIQAIRDYGKLKAKVKEAEQLLDN